MYMCPFYGRKAVIITERKTAFRRVVSGVRQRTSFGESAAADKVLKIGAKNKVGNKPFVVVLKRKVPIVESNVLISSGSVLSGAVLGLYSWGKVLEITSKR